MVKIYKNLPKGHKFEEGETLSNLKYAYKIAKGYPKEAKAKIVETRSNKTYPYSIATKRGWG